LRAVNSGSRDAFFAQQEENLKYPNALWAISQIGNRYKFAAMIGYSESWLSRRLLGRVPFTPGERQIIAKILDYQEEWLFQEPQPPAREGQPRGLKAQESRESVRAGA
jgi:hypothetical protein